MQTLEWKRKSLGSFLADTVAADFAAWLSPRCPECQNLLIEKPTEVIADFGNWHLGWRKYVCANCETIGSCLVLCRDTHDLQYQTHPVG